MKTLKLYEKLEEIIPPTLSCAWDNDGLSVLPYKDHESKRILISLDVRGSVIGYAEKNGFDTVITHHPLIFAKLCELNGSTVPSEKAVRLVRAGIAAMSFHTRYDAVDGGVSDILCETLGLSPDGKFGEGDCARLCTSDAVTFDAFAKKVKGVFGPAHFFCEKAADSVRRVAVCGGSAGDFTDEALALGADTFVCGEMRYHSAIDAADAGLNIVCVGHYESEAPALGRLCKTVSEISGAYTEIYGVSQYVV